MRFFIISILLTLGCSDRKSTIPDDADYQDENNLNDLTNSENATDSEKILLEITIPETWNEPQDNGICETGCDNTLPESPSIFEAGGSGNITTYGSITDPMPSHGGACNYGETQIYYFAAMHVSIIPGDEQGQWQEGRICGQCVKVSSRSPEGWRHTVVRITDKCPDAHCGIDLGGAPTIVLMEEQPGRYDGTWQFVSCSGIDEVSDGPPALFVKDGSNPYWALIQIRNPPSAVKNIYWKKIEESISTPLSWASEAENFYTIPTSILQSEDTYLFKIDYLDGSSHSIEIIGNQLAIENNLIPLE